MSSAASSRSSSIERVKSATRWSFSSLNRPPQSRMHPSVRVRAMLAGRLAGLSRGRGKTNQPRRRRDERHHRARARRPRRGRASRTGSRRPRSRRWRRSRTRSSGTATARSPGARPAGGPRCVSTTATMTPANPMPLNARVAMSAVVDVRHGPRRQADGVDQGAADEQPAQPDPAGDAGGQEHGRDLREGRTARRQRDVRRRPAQALDPQRQEREPGDDPDEQQRDRDAARTEARRHPQRHAGRAGSRVPAVERPTRAACASQVGARDVGHERRRDTVMASAARPNSTNAAS